MLNRLTSVRLTSQSLSTSTTSVDGLYEIEPGGFTGIAANTATSAVCAGAVPIDYSD